MKIEAYIPAVYTAQDNICEWCLAKDPGVLNPTQRSIFLEHINGAGKLCPHCVAKLFRFLEYWTSSR